MDPNESEPDDGLVDSSDLDDDDDMVQGPRRHRARAGDIDDNHNLDLADDDDHYIIIHYDSNSDYSPCDEFEGPGSEQPADRQSTIKARRRRRKRSNAHRSRFLIEPLR